MRAVALVARAFVALSLVGVAFFGCGNSPQSSQHDAFVPMCTDYPDGTQDCFCYDAAHLQLSTFHPRGFTAPGQATNVQHVVQGACESYVFYWVDVAGNTFWYYVVTNCAPANLGGPAAAHGFPASCLQAVVGGGGPGGGDPKMLFSTYCDCCQGGECGTACQPAQFISCPGPGDPSASNYQLQAGSAGGPGCDCTH